MSIQPLWLTSFIEILLVLEFQLTKTYFDTFSYKAHFRPKISSNGPTNQGGSQTEVRRAGVCVAVDGLDYMQC